MAQAWLKKYLVMKPEVTKIFNDLDSYLNFCRFELLPYNEADLYNKQSETWNKFIHSTRQSKNRNNNYRKQRER
jgi:hypothetical protein